MPDRYRFALVARFLVPAGLALPGAWVTLSSGCGVEDGRSASPGGSPPPASTPAPTDRATVTLDPEAAGRSGIRAEPLRFGSLPELVSAYGSFVHPEPLLALQRRVALAEIAVRASSAEWERTRELHEEDGGASLKALETAEARYRSDELELRHSRLELQNEWGSELAGLPASEREGLLDRLVGRTAALARVSLPRAERLEVRPERARVESPGGANPPLEASRILEAPEAESSVEGKAFLLLLEGDGLAWRPGEAAVARLEASGRKVDGALIPSSAAVRFEGRTWVYLEETAGRYRRRAIPTRWPAEDGWIVPEGFQEGESIVVEGAQTLLSEELRSSIRLEEEDED